MIYQRLEEHLFYRNTISPFCTCGFSNPVTSEVKLFTTIVHGQKPLAIATKNSILNVVGFLGPPLFINITISIFFPEKLSLAASEILK